MYMNQCLKSVVIVRGTTFAAEHINVIAYTTDLIEWKMTCKENQPLALWGCQH
jgi:hypothetical protein